MFNKHVICFYNMSSYVLVFNFLCVPRCASLTYFNRRVTPVDTAHLPSSRITTLAPQAAVFTAHVITCGLPRGFYRSLPLLPRCQMWSSPTHLGAKLSRIGQTFRHPCPTYAVYSQYHSIHDMFYFKLLRHNSSDQQVNSYSYFSQ